MLRYFLPNSLPFILSAPHSPVALASLFCACLETSIMRAFAHPAIPAAVLPSEHAVVAFFDSLPRLGAPSFKSLTQIFVTAVPIFTTCHAAAEHLSHVIRNSPKLESIALPGPFILTCTCSIRALISRSVRRNGDAGRRPDIHGALLAHHPHSARSLQCVPMPLFLR